LFYSKVYIDLNWLKLALYVIAKFSATQAYSAVILHAPEIFPTHLRFIVLFLFIILVLMLIIIGASDMEFVYFLVN